jgi:hypothetical protein
MDWFKGYFFTGNSHISWENLWFPVDFPLNQSIDYTDCLMIRNCIIRRHGLNITDLLGSNLEAERCALLGFPRGDGTNVAVTWAALINHGVIMGL